MGTLTALLNLSQNALEANQSAIDITSNNVANANTAGYTAEVATWKEGDTVSLGDGIQASTGASVTAVSLRNLVLNQQVNIQTQLEASSSAESTALSDLQSIFGLTTTSTTAVSTTIGTDMNTFFSSLSSLEASPSSSSARQAVLSAAGTLAEDFNTASSQITQQSNALNQQVLGNVSEINSLTSSIAKLNLQIESNSPTSDAGTLEDQRQEDLTQLSQYIGFNQTKTENNGLTLTTATGQVLVSGGLSFALSTASVGGNLNVLTSDGQDITQVLDGTESGITGGSLGGVLKARDTDLPTISTSLDSLAYAIGNAVNTVNEQGLDANGNAGTAIFKLPATSVGAASTISVLSTVTPNSIAAAGVGEGSSGSKNATALSAIATDPLLNGQDSAEYYASLLTQLGDTVSSVSGENTTQQASLTQLTTQQSSYSSVSLDQEAANLTMYERSYDAAAKVFTIVDQLMASALNLGVEAAVS
jgi:flagellar hook-associated protein 1 FlgK